MDTAQRLRRENIAEYILYIWQLEDLLRAIQFSPEAIYSQLVAPRKLHPNEAEATLAWYVELAELLEREGKGESGHIEHTIHLIADLHNLHLQLLELPVGLEYRMHYDRLSEVLPDLRELHKGELSDTELAFRALYAAMLYRIKGEGARGAVVDTIEYVSPVIAQLAKTFGQIERGELNLFAKE
ncbi:MAG: DUF4924 family protein [Rikenellaceae bacterium]